MASRLSYFLTNDMPDDKLFAAAASGALDTPAGVQAQAARLLALPGGARRGARVLLRAAGARQPRHAARVHRALPEVHADARRRHEAGDVAGLEDLVFGRDGDYRRLFDQPETFVNAELAALYGVPAPAGSGFARVTLPASTSRVGLLGQAGVLAARDHADGTSPTRRGLFVLTRLLCQDLPLAPPANLQIPPPPTACSPRDSSSNSTPRTPCAPRATR